MDVMEIGKAIRDRRKAMNFTIEDIAALMNVSYRIWSEVERGKNTAQINTVIKMCQAVGLDLMVVARGDHP